MPAKYFDASWNKDGIEFESLELNEKKSFPIMFFCKFKNSSKVF